MRHCRKGCRTGRETQNEKNSIKKKRAKVILRGNLIMRWVRKNCWGKCLLCFCWKFLKRRWRKQSFSLSGQLVCKFDGKTTVLHREKLLKWQRNSLRLLTVNSFEIWRKKPTVYLWKQASTLLFFSKNLFFYLKFIKLPNLNIKFKKKIFCSQENFKYSLKIYGCEVFFGARQ